MKESVRLTTEQDRETCLLVGVELRLGRSPTGGAEPVRLSAEESLHELAELAEGAGAEVLGETIQTREAPDPATVIGRGKVEEVRAWAAEVEADIVIFDRDLAPTQQRNLEKALDCRILDRTQLILDIFARHARTREGRLQVELAQLHYMLPRLTGRGVAMSRLGAGIGTRGPGETKLETDRRRISQRMEKLKTQLESVRTTRKLQRKKRSAVPLATVALVGYTNAGKSTLFNALTAAEVIADSRMFATLDPTLRVLDLPSHRRILLSDTVGFISRLPPALIQAFRATLEEVTEAAMILHVVDIASPYRAEYISEVENVLDGLGAGDKPRLLVLNKVDLLEAGEVEAEARGEAVAQEEDTVAVSALRGQGLDALRSAIDGLLPGDDVEEVRYRFSHQDGEKLSFLYDHARVLERNDRPEGVEITALAAESVRRRLAANAV